jgi:hypothetical protein
MVTMARDGHYGLDLVGCQSNPGRTSARVALFAARLRRGRTAAVAISLLITKPHQLDLVVEGGQAITQRIVIAFDPGASTRIPKFRKGTSSVRGKRFP